MDPDALTHLLKGTIPSVVDTDSLLDELQKAADEHQRILDRQAELIARLREEMRDVQR